MSDSTNSITSLVNQSLPTSAPRVIHSRVATLYGRSGGTVTSRLLAETAAIRDLAQHYSRIHWVECELVFVPLARAATMGFIISVGASPDNDVPSDLAGIFERPTCGHLNGGSADSLPPVLAYKIDFNGAHLSTLVKPLPVEMHRGAVAFHFDYARLDAEQEVDKEDALLQVFVRGVVVCGGTL